MRTVLLALLFTAPAHAHEAGHEPVITTGSELLEWCRRETEAAEVGAGRQPVNWRARHYEKGNVLVVEGRWRVDGKDVEIECRLPRGARAEHVEITVGARS